MEEKFHDDQKLLNNNTMAKQKGT